MFSYYDIGSMLAGVAFFLMAMKLMEEALRQLAGRRFKLFLKNKTDNKLKAIGGGAVVSGLLQSSSVVNLLVLSMAGASVLKMENALALILGSNLGTTVSSWLMAALGFQYNINSIVLPVAGITGISIAFLKTNSRWYLWFRIIFSLAFLLIALSFIKTGMEGWIGQTNLSAFNGYPLIIFLLLGVVLTTIVQSSSATMALALSALYTNAITLPVAMAFVLGAEIGTTLKLFLAASKGPAVKKRVALGNFLFNGVTAAVIFILLHPVHQLITQVLNINDHLIALVLFQTFINLSTVILFYPFLSPFSKFLLSRYSRHTDESFYITKVPVTDTALALEALEMETKHLISHVADYSLHSFHLNNDVAVPFIANKEMHHHTLEEKYNYIKQLQGEMHIFYLKLQNHTSNPQDTERLAQLISAIRNAMYAAKNIKDAQHDIIQVRNSSNNIKYQFYTHSKAKLSEFYKRILLILENTPQKKYAEELATLYRFITSGYAENLQLLYKESVTKQVTETEIATLINLNREMYTSFKSLLFGLKDYLLSAKEAEYFDGLPGFIR